MSDVLSTAFSDQRRPTKSQTRDAIARVANAFAKVGVSDSLTVATLMKSVPRILFDDVKCDIEYDSAVDLITRQYIHDPVASVNLEEAVRCLVLRASLSRAESPDPIPEVQIVSRPKRSGAIENVRALARQVGEDGDNLPQRMHVDPIVTPVVSIPSRVPLVGNVVQPRAIQVGHVLESPTYEQLQAQVLELQGKHRKKNVKSKKGDSSSSSSSSDSDVSSSQQAQSGFKHTQTLMTPELWDNAFQQGATLEEFRRELRSQMGVDSLHLTAPNSFTLALGTHLVSQLCLWVEDSTNIDIAKEMIQFLFRINLVSQGHSPDEIASVMVKLNGTKLPRVYRVALKGLKHPGKGTTTSRPTTAQARPATQQDGTGVAGSKFSKAQWGSLSKTARDEITRIRKM